jgi:L-aspartate oxidase
VLLRRDGSALMEGAHPLGSLAPRDVVAREIDRALKISGDPYVLLDCSPIPESELRARFPNILAETRRRGLDILRDPLPVVPAAHYACGGVVTDTEGQSSLEGLFATGEVACTGVHGANRLASNSLLEAVVFAHRAAGRLRSLIPGLPLLETPLRSAPRGVAEGVIPVHDRAEVRSLMWDLVGIVRSEERLAFAEGRLHAIAGQIGHLVDTTRPDGDLFELRNLLHTSLLIVRSARLRRESRGLHRSLEHPHRDNERFLRDTVLLAPAAGGAEQD